MWLETARQSRCWAKSRNSMMSLRTWNATSNTTVFAQWDGTATLLNGDPYINRGLHVFTLRWGKLHALEEFYDSQATARGLAAQAAAGVEEASAEQILGKRAATKGPQRYVTGGCAARGHHRLVGGRPVSRRGKCQRFPLDPYSTTGPSARSSNGAVFSKTG
jgi:hypothetical protein